MENTEELFQALEEFSKKKQKVISKELDEYLHFVARTGDPIFQWVLVKHLFKEKLLNVITEFYENSGIDIPHCPNVDVFNYETMKNALLEKIDAFAAAPFTIQRICELLTFPRKQYSRIDKFMRAFEKNILVVSTRNPGHVRHLDSEIDNGDGQESLVNGSDSNSDYNVDVDMEDVSSWKENNDPLTYSVHNAERSDASGEDDYIAQNGPIHREMMTVEEIDRDREDDEEEDERRIQPSTSSGDEVKMDEDEGVKGSEEVSREETRERLKDESPKETVEETEQDEDVDVDKVVGEETNKEETKECHQQENETAIESPSISITETEEVNRKDVKEDLSDDNTNHEEKAEMDEIKTLSPEKTMQEVEDREVEAKNDAEENHCEKNDKEASVPIDEDQPMDKNLESEISEEPALDSKEVSTIITEVSSDQSVEGLEELQAKNQTSEITTEVEKNVEEMSEESSSTVASVDDESGENISDVLVSETNDQPSDNSDLANQEDSTMTPTNSEGKIGESGDSVQKESVSESLNDEEITS